MNKKLFLIIILAFLSGLVAGSLFFAAPAPPVTQNLTQTVPQTWTCSMHPEIRQPKPGKCPKCFMDLIPLSEDAFSSDPRTLKLSDAAKELAQVKIAPVYSGPATRTLRLPGTLQLDETRLRHVTAWVAGRIDKLYVNYTGIPVKLNDHMAEFYSPDLIAAQEELRRTVGNESLHLAVTERLLRWGISPQQIEQFIAAPAAKDLVTINSPSAGIVIEQAVKEGMYVNQGTRLFSIADMSRLWLIASVYERDIQWLRYGQKVSCEFEAYPGRIFPGTISFISPVLQTSSRTVDARINVDNAEGLLKPGMFGRITIKVSLGNKGEVINPALSGKWISPMHPEVIKDGPGKCDVCGMDLVPVESLGINTSADATLPLLVPETAVLWSGPRSIVFRKTADAENLYEATEVVVGPNVDDGYLVFSGLEAGDEVVVEGAFKLDSEQQIRAGMSMMSPHRDLTPIAEQESLSPEAVTAVEDLLRPCLEISSLLAQDQLPSQAAHHAHARLSGLKNSDSAALQGIADRMMPVLMKMADEKDIIKAREQLNELTPSIRELVILAGSSLSYAIHEDFCPMAFDNKGAVWFQEASELANPYFGAMMLRCGETKKVWSKGAK